MIFDRLLEIARTAPATSGLRYEGSFHSYADLARRIERLAAGFRERGLGDGSVVALLIPNSPDIFAVAHALFAIGGIAMPLSPSATRAELAALARKTDLAAIIAAPSYASAAELLATDAAPNAAIHLTSELSDIERPPSRLASPAGSTTAIYLFSSGSTGLPKIVPHTHSELVADGIRTSTAWKLQPDDVVANILPPNFAMGFLMGATNALSGGATTFYWNDALPLALSRRKLLESLVGERVTLFGAVPAMHEIIAAQTGEFDLRLRIAFSGGAALRRSTYDLFKGRFGQALRQAYGSTEAIMVAHNDAEDVDARWDSVGPPAGDAEVRIAEENDEGVGELLIRSSSLMQGYLDDNAANAAAFSDGWFRSGDLAALDEDGRISIKGRTKLLIEVSGYKIDPMEVEEVISSHPSVAELAVTGVPDARTGNRLRAFVVRRADVSSDDIVTFARARLSNQKVPAEVEFLDSLPKSSTGKILRAKLMER